MVKKHFLLFCALALLAFASSCNKKKKPKQETTETVTSVDVSNALDTYAKLEKFSLTEQTVAQDKEGNSYSSNRITNIDFSDKYVSSKIYYGEIIGHLKRVDNTYYYQLGNSGYKVNYATEDSAYEAVGISQMFELEYSVKGNIATAFLTDTNIVSKFDNLFKNVNMDLNTNHSYNSYSFLKINIEFEKKDIEKITFDLGYVYGSFYSSITRTLEFQDDDFEKEDLDLSSGEKYYVDTGATLDTYVIEMVQQYGDSIYIHSGDFDMLIDAGDQNDGPNVNEMLNTYCEDHVLELLIATHGHSDHIYGFANGALDSILDVQLIVDYGYTDGDPYEGIRTKYDSDYYSAFDCVNLQNGASKIFRFSDDLSVEILDTGQYAETGKPLHTDCSDENEHSVVCLLTFGVNTYLYTGDISQNYEQALRRENIGNVTVYKAAHHGAVSNSTNSTSFLNYINPQICVVSAAINDQYGWQSQFHPTKSFISRILNTPNIKASKNLYYNGTMGTIHLLDNGVDLPTVTGLGPKRGYYFNDELVTGEENLKFTETNFYKYR